MRINEVFIHNIDTIKCIITTKLQKIFCCNEKIENNRVIVLQGGHKPQARRLKISFSISYLNKKFDTIK